MGERSIIKDSIKILAFIYKKGETNSDEIIKESGYDYEHFKKIIDYLEGEYLIKEPIKMIGGNIIDIKCSSEGIKAIEQPHYFHDNKGNNIVININVDSIFKTDAIFQGKIF